MAIRTFNSVGGFSVGEIPDTIITNTGNVSAYHAAFTGNVAVSNTNASFGVKTDKLYYSNGVPWTFVQAGGVDGQIQFNDGGTNLGGSSGLTYNKTTGLLTVTGTANIGSINTTGQIVATSNVTAPYFIGDVIGNISGNIQVQGPDTGILFNDSGNANSVGGFTFNKSNNFVSLSGNLSAGNISATNVGGTLTTASQTNITSVGTLTSLTVTNTITGGNLSTGGNLTVSGAVISHLVPANDNTYNLGNATNRWQNAYISSNIVLGSAGTAYLRATGATVYTDALYAANNMSAGTFTSRGDAEVQGTLTVGGNLTVAGTTTYINVETVSIKDPIISLGGANNGANATSFDGKDRGVFLRNYTSGGGGTPINEFMGWDTSAGQFAFGSNVSITDEVVTFNEYGNIRANVVVANVSGTILTAEQTNITSVGTLGTLSVSNWANINTANIATLKASGLNYPTSDGSSGQFLKTDGAGALSWATVSTSSITNGTSNVNVQENANVQIVAGGTSVANITPTGANITGTLNVSGNATVGLMAIGNSTVRSTTVTTTTTSQTTLVSTPAAQARAIEYFVTGTNQTGGKYSVATVSMVHDATSADYSVYGTVNLPASSTTGSLAVTYAGAIANLVVTPSSAESTVWTVQYRTII